MSKYSRFDLEWAVNHMMHIQINTKIFEKVLKLNNFGIKMTLWYTI